MPLFTPASKTMNQRPVNPSLKVESICPMCNLPFSHYKKTEIKYCSSCIAKHSTKECAICHKPLIRPRGYKLDLFLKLDCHKECLPQTKVGPSLTAKPNALFEELILGSPFLPRVAVSLDALEEAVEENCGYFRLYFLYNLLEPFNDGTPLSERSLKDRCYLLDILRRIKNCNEVLQRNPTKRSRNISFISNNKTAAEPTDFELRKIEMEAYKNNNK